MKKIEIMTKLLSDEIESVDVALSVIGSGLSGGIVVEKLDRDNAIVLMGLTSKDLITAKEKEVEGKTIIDRIIIRCGNLETFEVYLNVLKIISNQKAKDTSSD